MNKVAIFIISDGIGGAEQVVWQMLKSFSVNSNYYLIVNSEIAHFYKSLLPAEKILDIGNIYFYRNKRYKFIKYFINNRFYSLKRFFIWRKAPLITRFLKKNNIALIHSHLEGAVLLSLRLKKSNPELKVYFTVHGVIQLINDKTLQATINKRKLGYIKDIDRLIFVSNYVLDLYKHNNIKFQDYRVIYNAISPIVHDKKDNFNEVFTILYVGGTKPIKGYDLLVDTIDLIHKQNKTKLKVIVLGPISKDCKIIKYIKEKEVGSYFEIVGFVNPPKHLEYFKKSDILFMPSRSEALPIAAIEASLLNLPIVATNVGGLPEIIANNQNGFICSLNANDYASKILEIKNNYTEFISHTIAYNSKNNYKFDLEHMKNQLIEYYNT